LEETQDKNTVTKNKNTPLTLEEFDAAAAGDEGKNPKTDTMNVIDVLCAGCEPKKKTKKAKKEAVEA
jgi:hypothetical protein